MKEQLRIFKIGGNILDKADVLHAFLDKVAQIDGKKIIVHGGGKLATQLGKQLNIPAQMIDGRRITDAATLDVVVMVYAGLVNKQITAYLQSLSIDALGICGADLNLIPAQKRPLKNNIDYGFVGDIPTDLPIKNWTRLLNNHWLPVVAPISHDTQGQLLNTNADTIAANIATSLSSTYEVELIYIFEKKGVLQDAQDDASVITSIHPDEFQALVSNGVIKDGMIPKLENAINAVTKGVKSVKIGLADELHEIINGKSGTTISYG